MTGSTDLRDTEVQFPKITSTSCTVSNSRAFSANNGQSEAGSTTTGTSFSPRRPPFAFCCSISINMVSFNVVSEMAIVPDRECSTPTFISAAAWLATAHIIALAINNFFIIVSLSRFEVLFYRSVAHSGGEQN